MKKHEDYVTHINNPEDEVYLRTKHFPVNMRLFHSSPQYKAIILSMCDYIREMCLHGAEGYKKPHGMSGANLALGFNIIGVTRNRNQNDEYCQIMINPVIEKYGTWLVATKSNCGSLTLPEPIDVERSHDIVVDYYDEEGKHHWGRITRHEAAFSVQHEVDHNLGILIIDREIKENE